MDQLIRYGITNINTEFDFQAYQQYDPNPIYISQLINNQYEGNHTFKVINLTVQGEVGYVLDEMSRALSQYRLIENISLKNVMFSNSGPVGQGFNNSSNIVSFTFGYTSDIPADPNNKQALIFGSGNKFVSYCPNLTDLDLPNWNGASINCTANLVGIFTSLPSLTEDSIANILDWLYVIDSSVPNKNIAEVTGFDQNQMDLLSNHTNNRIDSIVEQLVNIKGWTIS